MPTIEEEDRSSTVNESAFADLGVFEKDELIDSIAVLTKRSFGDVRRDLSEDSFEELAIQALRSFKRYHYRQFLGGDPIPTGDELTDLDLLRDALESLDLELSEASARDQRLQLKKERKEILEAIQRAEEEHVLHHRLRDSESGEPEA